MKNILIAVLSVLVWLPFQGFSQCGNLVFSDEFNGNSVDNTKWTIQTGNGCPSLCGWGNSELQTYTNNSNNVRVENGNLVLQAIQSNGTYTSGRLTSSGKFSRKYGRFEIRAKLPAGTGLWPAFWLLPDNGNWPRTGEIDIMEYRGDWININTGTLHYGDYWPNNRHDGTAYTLPNGNFTDSYHVFAIEWSLGQMRWYVDGVLYKTETANPNTLNPPSNNDPWPWDAQNFYMIVNLAIGGSNTPFTGNQNPNFGTSGTMLVDYIRVYDAPQPQINVSGKSKVFQNASATYSIPQGSNQTFSWSVPPGATILSGQNTNQINVNWGSSQGGDVVVNAVQNAGAACSGKTFTYSNAVSVYNNSCKFIFQNYEDRSTMNTGFISGQFFVDNNPGINNVNNSSKVGRYTRNSTQQYDAFFYDNALLDAGSTYTSGSYQFKMDVYTSAPVGSTISIQLGNMAAWGAYPAGVHSSYNGTTSATNQWHTVTFTYANSPDANGSSYANNLDRMVLLFQPNSNSNATFYIDNIRREYVPTPATLTINGLGAVSNNQSGVTYAATGGNANNRYSWQVPLAASIAGIATSSSINVNYALQGGSVSVQEVMNTGCYGPVASKGVSVGGNSCALFSDEYNTGNVSNWLSITTGTGLTAATSNGEWRISSTGYGEWANLEYTINNGSGAATLDFTNPVNNPILKIRARATSNVFMRVTFIDNMGKVAQNRYLDPLNGFVVNGTSREYTIDFNGQFWDEYTGGGTLDQSKIAKIRVSLNPGFVSFPVSVPGIGLFNSAFVGDAFIDYIRIGNDCASPLPDFSANDVVVCNTGQSITFTDLSGNTTTTTGYVWNFGAGATPASSTTRGTQSVSYSSSGWKTVSLTLNGTAVKTKSNYIYVSNGSQCPFQDDYANQQVSPSIAAQGNFSFREIAGLWTISTAGHGEWETFSQGLGTTTLPLPVDFSCGISPTIKIRAKASSPVALRVNLVDANNTMTNNAATVAQTMQLTTSFQEFTLTYARRFVDQYTSGGPFAVDSTQINKLLFSLNPGYASFPWNGYNSAFNGTVDIDYINLGNCQATNTLLFVSPATGMLGGTVTVSTTGNSAQSIQLSVANGTGSALLNGSTLSLTGVGTVTITAFQPATASVLGATITQVFQIGKANRSLTITSPNAGQAGTSVNLTGVATPSASIQWSLLGNNALASISGSTLVLLNAGTVTVVGTVATDANYNTVTATQIFQISPKTTPTITFASVNKTFGDPTFTLNASSNSPAPITYSVISGSAIVSVQATSGLVSILGAGIAVVQATQSSQGIFANGAQTATITVAKANRSISITSGNTIQVNGQQGLTASATPSATAVSWSISNQSGSVSTVSGSTLLAGNQAGVVQIRADVAGDANYNAAFALQNITITSLQVPNMVFTNVTTTFGASPIPMVANSNSTAPITYSIISGNAYAQISASTGTVTILGAGVVQVQASQSATGGFSSVSRTAVLTINKANRSFAITSNASGQAGTQIQLTYTALPSASPTWSVQNGSGLASLNGSSLVLQQAGMVSVAGFIAADANYNAATATQIIQISAQTSPQLSFTNVTKTFGDQPFGMSASSNSPGAMTYSIIQGGNIAQISASSGTVTILGAGIAIVQVSQASSGSFAAATQTAQLAINKATRTLSITSASFGPVGSVISLTANGNLPASPTWSVTNITGSASINGNILNLSQAGTVSVTAFVASDNNYQAASVSQIVTIQVVNSLEENEVEKWQIFPNPFQDQVQLPLALIGQPYRIVSMDGMVVMQGMVQESVLSLGHLVRGIYMLEWFKDQKPMHTKLVKQ